MKSIPKGKVAEHKNIWLAGIPDLTPTVTPQNDFHTQRKLKRNVLVGLSDSRSHAAECVVCDPAGRWVYLQYAHHTRTLMIRRESEGSNGVMWRCGDSLGSSQSHFQASVSLFFFFSWSKLIVWPYDRYCQHVHVLSRPPQLGPIHASWNRDFF